MPVHTRAVTTFAVTAALGIGLDQATKAIVAATEEGKPPIQIIGRVLTIDVSRNSGAAFSFAPAATILFSCLAVAIAVVIARQARRLSSVAWAIALGLLLAGAIGNLCDRLFRTPGFGRGAVVDFIDLQHFATFNVADSCLTVGVVLGLLLSLRGIPMASPAQPETGPPEPGPPGAEPAEAEPHGAADPESAHPESAHPEASHPEASQPEASQAAGEDAEAQPSDRDNHESGAAPK
jgi:signal peptidase II